MRVDREGLGERLAGLLASLYAVQRTSSAIALSDDDHSDFCGRYLGGSVSRKQLATVLNGEGCHYVRSLCKRAVDRHERGEDVPQAVKRDAFRRDARHSIRSYEEFGLCASGSDQLFDALELLAVKRCAVDVSILDEAAILQEIKRGSDDEY